MTHRDKTLALIDKLDIPHRAVTHAPVFTVAESSEVLSEKRPIKNLLVKEKGNGRKILVIMDGNTRLDLDYVSKELGTKRLSFASSETLLATLGVTPGSVSLFSILHEGSGEVEVVLDEILLSESELGFHPNENTETIFIPGSSLTRIVEHTGHSLHIIKLSTSD